MLLKRRCSLTRLDAICGYSTSFEGRSGS
jgi:hypothetical protein